VNTIAVCDTEPIAMAGLRGLLEPVDGLSVVAAKETLADGLEAVREQKPSLFLVDHAFGGPAVLDAVRAVRGAECPPAVIVWGAQLSEVEAVRLLQAGATAVVRKTSSLETLRNCIQAVRDGNTWIEQALVPAADRQARTSRSMLTVREVQVMELVEQGMKNKEIATVLGIRTGTVKIHLKHIFEKTGVRGRYGLALSGLREKGLLAIAI
jgi:two-component system nitrate/nitrite response regulator NarL